MRFTSASTLLLAASSLGLLLALGSSCTAVLDYGPNRELPPSTGGAGGEEQGCKDCDPPGECMVAECIDGECSVSAMRDGEVPSDVVQEAGDCLELQCLCGSLRSVADDTDVSADDLPCTVSTCSFGVPLVDRPLPRGTAEPGNPERFCDGEGLGVDCLAASDCNDAISCGQWACVDGECVVMDLEDVEVIQTPGNCQVETCNADGDIDMSTDDTDLPDDNNPCTDDVCTSGVPSHVLLSAVACGNGGTCLGGECTCATKDECPDDVAPCSAWLCVAGICVVADKSGQVVAEPPYGDCKRTECNADGLEVQVAYDDKPADQGECNRAECRAGFAHQVPRERDDGCDAGVCDGDGSCVECTTPAQCAASPCQRATCEDGFCGETAVEDGDPASEQVPGDCHVALCLDGGVSNELQDSDLPNDANDCTCDTCFAGDRWFVAVPAGTSCSNGNGTCNGDIEDPACDCGPEGCSCTPLVKAACPPRTCGEMADNCGGIVDCSGEKDGGETDVDCGGPVAGCSARCDNGQHCLTGSDCANGHCVDGYCCNSNCAETCEACDLPDNEGECLPLPSDGEVDEECDDGTGECNGFGECAHGLGHECTSPFACASGYCESGVCCDGDCDGLCEMCNESGSCEPLDRDDPGLCPAGQACDGDGSCLKTDGEFCGADDSPSDDAECLSTFCVDGYCCFEECPECKECDVDWGTCTNTPQYVDDCVDADKVCDGAGMCKLANGQACGTDGTLCASGFCTNGVCCNTGCGGDNPDDCFACDVAGLVGSCATVTPGTVCDTDMNPATAESCCGPVCQDMVMVCSTMSAETCVETLQAGGNDVVCP